MTKAFIATLREIIDLLGKYSDSVEPGAHRWDGRAYTQATSQSCHPGAAKWWACLSAIADMIELQDSPPSNRQRAYLTQVLFGGMGSFNDFVLDAQHVPEAIAKNRELDRLREVLFHNFEE
jgi:hypothetical protein